MTIEVLSLDGSPCDTDICYEDGTPLYVKELRIHIAVGQPMTADLVLEGATLIGERATIDGRNIEPHFLMPHPTKPQFKTVKSITFDDGEVWNA